MEIDLDSVLAAKGTAKDDPRLKRKISTKHRNIIAGKIDDWKSCAAYLEVSDQDVDDIVEENRRVKHQRSSMLRLWWETNGNEATYLRLAKALARIDRRDLIEELLSMMASQSNQQSINVKGSKTLASSVCNLRWITCLIPAFVTRKFLCVTLLPLIIIVYLGYTSYKPKDVRPFALNQTLCRSSDDFIFRDLPTTRTVIFDREEELRQIVKMMDTVHIIGIHGGPGFGKSTLAIHVGYEIIHAKGAMARYIDVADKFSHFTFFDSMPEYPDSESERDCQTNTGDYFDRVVKELFRWSKLIKYHTVLVIDNCDDLLKNPSTNDMFIELIERMIQNANGNLFVIITSRQKLLVLDDFDHVVLSRLNTNSSIEVLLKFAPNISREDAELIVSLVEGCPLALKVVGKVIHFSGGRFTQRLNDELESRPLEVLDKVSLHKERFRVIMKSVFDQLTDLKDCGYYVSLFPGSFNYPAGKYIIPNSMRCLDGLLEQSLMEEYHLGFLTRYKMHRLIREYLKEVGESYKDYYGNLKQKFIQLFADYYSSYVVKFADKLKKIIFSCFDRFMFESNRQNIHYVVQLILSKTDDLSVVELKTLAIAIDQEIVSTSSIISSQLLYLMIGKIDEVCDILSSEKCGEVFSHIIQKLYAQCRCNNIKEYFQQFADQHAPCMELFQCNNIVQIINQSDAIVSRLPRQEKAFVIRIHHLHCGVGYRMYHFLLPNLIIAFLFCQCEYMLLYAIIAEGHFKGPFCAMLFFIVGFIKFTLFDQDLEMMVLMTVYFPAVIQLLFKNALFIIGVLLRLSCPSSLDRLRNKSWYRWIFGFMFLPLSYFELFVFWNLVPYCC